MKFKHGAKCVVQGWGLNKIIRVGKQSRFSNKKPNRAMQGTVNLLSGEKCALLAVDGVPVFDGGSQFCYGCDAGTCEQTAQGDSGMPGGLRSRCGGKPCGLGGGVRGPQLRVQRGEPQVRTQGSEHGNGRPRN